MGDQEMKFLPYDEAVKIVAAIQEEEDVHQKDHRVLTVYNHDDKEICWFDFDEVMNDVDSDQEKPTKSEVQDYILHRIPDWVLDM